MYLDGENPGSGPQDGSDSNGLNGDKVKIDTAVGTGHNKDGSHKSGVIDGAHLKSTCVDGSTLEQNAVSKKLQIKGGGVGTVQIADDAVTKDEIHANVAGSGMKQNADGSLSPDVDGSTVTIVGGKLVASGKSLLPISFGFDSATRTMMVGGAVVSGGAGVPIPAGTIKRLMITKYSGSVVALDCSLAVGDLSHFCVTFNDAVNEYIAKILINGVDSGAALDIQNSDPAYGTLIMSI